MQSAAAGLGSGSREPQRIPDTIVSAAQFGYQLIAQTAPSDVWHWPLPCPIVELVPRHKS